MSDRDDYGPRRRRARHGRHSRGGEDTAGRAARGGPDEAEDDTPVGPHAEPLRRRRPTGRQPVDDQDAAAYELREPAAASRGGRRRRPGSAVDDDPLGPPTGPRDFGDPAETPSEPRGRRRRGASAQPAEPPLRRRSLDPDPALDAESPVTPRRGVRRAAPEPFDESEPRGRRARTDDEPRPTPMDGLMALGQPVEPKDAPAAGRRRRPAATPVDRTPVAGLDLGLGEEEPPRRGSHRSLATAGSSDRSLATGGSRRARTAEPEPDDGPDDEAWDEQEEAEREDREHESEQGRGGRRGAARRARRSGSEPSAGRRGGGRRATKRRRRRGRLSPAVLVLVVVLVAGAGTGGAVLARNYVFPPDYDGEGSGEVEIVVGSGDTGTDVGETLEEAGVVASVRAFTNALDGAHLAPGTYRLREQMSADAAMELLMDPESRIGVRVTIREGLRASQILAELSEATEIPLEEFEAAYEDTAALELPSYAEKGAEGYLFPDTYMIDSGMSAAEILNHMVRRYEDAAAELELEQRAEALGYTPNEIMAVAAIVQAESGGKDDMPKISRVVYNRLDEGMKLQMDSTCFYAIGEYGIAMNAQQQQACQDSGSEYETYFREGLPAGPIVSPGADAINAALEPADGNWRFFVATDPENGVTEFAETEAEFWELVNRFNQSRQ
ncbi:endolytic transglycosylase MltG [Marinactinospora rubrisoli]|uniref:Endolytic murein transglycosylase n=1 Tax=Marinactinospora rubrisoli TaxID=2715399 RepID=A0ABW2KMU1_9ACTN